jgi:hypothetical protein
LFQLDLFSWVEETHESAQRKSSMLKTAASTILFSCENRVRFWKEYCLLLRCLRWRSHLFPPNRDIQPSWRNKWVSPNKPSILEAAASSTFFPCENSVTFQRNTFSNLGVAMWRYSLFPPSRPIQSCWRNTYISANKPITLEAASSTILFPCENQFMFWKEYFLQLMCLKVDIG